MRKLFSSDVEALKEKFHKIGIVVTAPSNQLKNVICSGYSDLLRLVWLISVFFFLFTALALLRP